MLAPAWVEVAFVTSFVTSAKQGVMMLSSTPAYSLVIFLVLIHTSVAIFSGKCKEQPSGTYALKRCAPGYRVFNDTHCEECTLNTAIEVPNLCNTCSYCKACKPQPPYYEKLEPIQTCEPSKLPVCVCRDGYERDSLGYCLKRTVPENWPSTPTPVPVNATYLDQSSNVPTEAVTESNPDFGNCIGISTTLPQSPEAIIWIYTLFVLIPVIIIGLFIIILCLLARKHRRHVRHLKERLEAQDQELQIYRANPAEILQYRQLNEGGAQIPEMIPLISRPPRRASQPSRNSSIASADTGELSCFSVPQEEVQQDQDSDGSRQEENGRLSRASSHRPSTASSTPSCRRSGSALLPADSNNVSGASDEPDQDSDGIRQEENGRTSRASSHRPSTASSTPSCRRSGSALLPADSNNASGASDGNNMHADVWNLYFCYEMYPDEPAGISVIFYDSKHRSWQHDVKVMAVSLSKMGFGESQRFEASSSKEVMEILDGIVKSLRDHPAHCLSVTFITHGTTEGALSEEGDCIGTESLKQAVIGHEHLVGIPKVFFLDFCLGEGTVAGAKLLRPVDSNGVPDELQVDTGDCNEPQQNYSATNNEIPEGSDIMMVFASTPGTQSYSDRFDGKGNQPRQKDRPSESWFVKAFSEQVVNYAPFESLDGIMHRVTSSVAQNVGHQLDEHGNVRRKVKQLVYVSKTFRRTLFFPPFFKQLRSSGMAIPHVQTNK